MQLLRRHFRSVQRRIVWRNLPPAFVFMCRGSLCAETTRLLFGSESIGSKYPGNRGASGLTRNRRGKF
jgi:hypothetical protein